MFPIPVLLSKQLLLQAFVCAANKYRSLRDPPLSH